MNYFRSFDSSSVGIKDVKILYFSQVPERCPNFLLVIEICPVIPIQTAYCERGNSCLNRIMCDFWSTLGVSTVEALSLIARMKIKELRSWAHKSERIFVHFTVTNVCVWLVKNLFWLVDQTCH